MIKRYIRSNLAAGGNDLSNAPGNVKQKMLQMAKNGGGGGGGGVGRGG